MDIFIWSTNGSWLHHWNEWSGAMGTIKKEVPPANFMSQSAAPSRILNVVWLWLQDGMAANQRYNFFGYCFVTSESWKGRLRGGGSILTVRGSHAIPVRGGQTSRLPFVQDGLLLVKIDTLSRRMSSQMMYVRSVMGMVWSYWNRIWAFKNLWWQISLYILWMKNVRGLIIDSMSIGSTKIVWQERLEMKGKWKIDVINYFHFYKHFYLFCFVKDQIS